MAVPRGTPLFLSCTKHDEAFAPNFHDRLQQFIDTMHGLEPAGKEGVLVAGDPEKEHVALVEKCGGIPYHPNQITHAVSI
ncbi:unnamed protein product [Gongylonema pulchrum]|uniref:Glucosamine-6-phosphate deaminase n=1 Tax=Gongylonema pulchrum TaxID=637853 RepID=A0A183EYM1_9BILA|nr:unnamed protein product [Gongylonema pulchrum]